MSPVTNLIRLGRLYRDYRSEHSLQRQCLDRWVTKRARRTDLLRSPRAYAVVLRLRRPAKAAHDPFQLSLVLVKGREDAGFSGLGAVINEVKTHQCLADSRWAGYQSRRPRPKPTFAQKFVQSRDSRRGMLAPELITRIDMVLCQAGENFEAPI